MELLNILYLPFALFLYILTSHFIARLRHLPPSPFLTLPIIGNLHMIKTPLFKSLADISSYHGPVVLLRFGCRRVLVISSAAAVAECLQEQDIAFANRPDLLPGKYLGYNYTTLVWAPYGDHWRNLRKLYALEILSSHRLQTLQAIRADEVKLMLKRVFVASEKKQSIGIRSLFFELILNVMMRMIAGKRYYGESVEEFEEAKNFRAIVQETMKIGGASNKGDFMPFLRWLGLDKSEEGLRILQEKRDTFMQALVKEFKDKMQGSQCQSQPEENKNKTLIEVLLELQEKDPDYYTDELIRNIMLVILSAGTDTSMATMEWALSLMLNHPSTFKKARQQIHRAVGTNRFLDESDLPNIPYVRCIVNETLRMYPTAPLLVPHQSSEDCLVGSYRVPRGTMLLVNSWAIQNDAKNWPDPRRFCPERFERDEGGAKDGHKWLPFGTGRRRCPGEGLAMRMVEFGLGSIIQCFEWEKIGNETVDMSEGSGVTMPREQPLVANCMPRPEMLHLLKQI